jgi:hypothetical protein
MQFFKGIDVLVVKAAQYFHRSGNSKWLGVQWLKEELIELAIEQRPISERFAKDEAASAQSRPSAQPTQRARKPWKSTNGNEGLELSVHAR